LCTPAKELQIYWKYDFQTRADITVFDVNTGGQPDPADLNKLTLQFQAVLCDLPEVTSGSFSQFSKVLLHKWFFLFQFSGREFIFTKFGDLKNHLAAHVFKVSRLKDGVRHGSLQQG
jgi:hypothetical protein